MIHTGMSRRFKIFAFALLAIVLSIGALATRTNNLSFLLQQPAPANIAGDLPKSLEEAVATGDAAVLGRYIEAPRIYISGDGKYSSGGVITQAITDAKTVRISGYKLAGAVKLTVFEANETALLNYLLHDEENQQTQGEPNVEGLNQVASFDHQLSSDQYGETQIPLPVGDTGIWYVQVDANNGATRTGAFVVRSRVGVVTKEGDSSLLFWGQDFTTKRSVTNGTVKVLNLQGGVNVLAEVGLSDQGVANTPLSAKADIALVSVNGDLAVVPINLQYLNGYYSEYRRFMEQQLKTRYFIFTDRPLYQPGDEVNFKSILRDDADVHYTIPGGTAQVKVYDGYYYEGMNRPPVFEQTFPISADGTIYGSFRLPAGAKTGSYSINVSIAGRQMLANQDEWWTGAGYFDVQFFRKPEYSLEVEVPQTEHIAGDKSEAVIKGSYFSGQPLAGEDVRYTVRLTDAYEIQYLADLQWQLSKLDEDFRYNFSYREPVESKTVRLDANGEARVPLDLVSRDGLSKIYSIEAELLTDSPEPARARRNVLVKAGEFGIYQDEYKYGSIVNQSVSLPITLVPVRSDGVVQNVELSADINYTNWFNSGASSWQEEKGNLPSVKTRTNNNGRATLSFTPTKPGSYTILVSGSDSRGNSIKNTFYAYVSSEEYGYYRGEQDAYLNVIPDKAQYEPTDTAKLTITSEIPDRDVLLTLERGWMDRYQVVRLQGKRGVATVPLLATDVPNMYAAVSSFANESVDTNVVELPVSAKGKQLVVTIATDNETYGPGETVNATITTTDVAGNPISADTAIWAVDKAIFELSDSNLGDVFDAFWFERYNDTRMAHSLEGIVVNTAEGGGGCFAADTQVLMADGKTKNIQDILAGEYVLTRSETSSNLVKAKVLGTHQVQVGGYLTINGYLKVTAEHILWLNGSWQTAGDAQIGDEFIDTADNAVKVTSIEWQQGDFTVYNLEVEQYHTYFADGVWVHNQKGEPRSVFEDTAYWNPAVRTDGSGKARVSFKLPDNLTTWTMAAVASTTDTKVGQTTHEIVVTKDVIVRPILPNLLRIGDELFLAALVQNFTPQAQTFAVALESDAAEVAEPVAQQLTLEPGKMRQVYWKVKPNKATETGKFTFSAVSEADDEVGDVIVSELPVRHYGFSEKKASTGQGASTLPIRLSQDAFNDQTSITLTLSPTMTGTLTAAMDYLLDYPYGCVEQTTSRLVPLIIAKRNPDLFGTAMRDRDVDEMIQKGLSRLNNLQLSDGGWSWYYDTQSDPFVTAYVVEYLLEAKAAGAAVDEGVLAEAKSYLESPVTTNNFLNTRRVLPVDWEQGREVRSQQIAKNYALMLLGVKDKVVPISDLSNLRVDVLAMAVMTNYRLGNTNAQTNGLTQLQAMARLDADKAYWPEGEARYFGSESASAALAMRAIVLAGGDRELAVKGARGLMGPRVTEYWSNTFGTAQTIRAIVDLARSGSELTPNYSYEVTLEGKTIASGRVTKANQEIEPIIIPVSDVNKGGSDVHITQEGQGQLYSTLVADEFHTDPEFPAWDGITITREYVNQKNYTPENPERYSLAVGDTVDVILTVEATSPRVYDYVVIHDELPAGLVPVNESLKNEEQRTPYGWWQWGESGREVTENGIDITLYQLADTSRVFVYKARVVSEGTFMAPPATVSVMYEPEIFGRTTPALVQTTGKSEVLPRTTIQRLATGDWLKSPWVTGGLAALAVLTVGGVAFVIRKRSSGLGTKLRSLVKREKLPPQQPPQPPAPPVAPPGEGLG